ncbi:MAG: ribosomal RNA small subunit methyltransferase A [Candidatus Lokiarchaeota archaeon]|nr:ribosomal RNA small subunit methyltransferase A [Candidatus Lokiarchaeota archaeon]
MNKNDVKLILKSLGIHPNKKFGQNFLIDEQLLDKIIKESNIISDDIILEIGAGLGVLTEKLAEVAKKVYAIEIESVFCGFISKKLQKHNNVEILQGDALRLEFPHFNKLVSNIPYSITGPILEKVFFKRNPPLGILTIEKSLAERIFCKDDYKTFSRITVSVNSFLNPVKKIDISKNSFFPRPKIDLSLIVLKAKQKIDKFLQNETTKKFYLRFIAGTMPYKNKNILNAIKYFLKNFNTEIYFEKKIKESLNSRNLLDKKVFQLTINEFIDIARTIYQFLSYQNERD